ncbi:hypothetical protein F3K44_33125 [Bacillus megaterium]|nr:hypothetical protein [Priestia megaterium]
MKLTLKSNYHCLWKQIEKEDKPEYIFVKNTQKTHDFSEFARRGMIERESRMEVGLFNRYS